MNLDNFSPDQLKSMSLDELKALSEAIRSRIIDVMAKNGGHLASSLGAVELIVALHKVFDSPKDKFVFDVGHQCYAHKILTGRNDTFESVRQFEGQSGFCHPAESEHDAFFTGHAGPALSSALGLAKSRDLAQSDETVIPVIGDATLTCGLLYEALNNVPKELKKFIVILNDNDMSIAKNVGAVTQILSRMINSPATNKFCHELGDILEKIPSVGDTLASGGGKLKRSLKNLVSGATFFEQFNLAYVGPEDGHDLGKLIALFEKVKGSPKPVLVHLRTVKGKGMEKAVENPVSYHGVKPFDKVSGEMHKPKSSAPTFPKVFGKLMCAIADRDPNLVVVTPAMPAGSCLTHMMKEHPERCIDVGIAEGHSATFAGGIAKSERQNVVLSIYSTFMQRAFDNIYHDVCIQEIPLVMAIDRAGIAGGDGITHNGIYDIGFLSEMPNMVIAQPRDGRVMRELFDVCFDWKRPTAIRYPNLPTVDEEPQVKRKLGQAEVLQEGAEVAIVTLGHMANIGHELCEAFEQTGVTPTLIDPVFVKPLDEALFERVLSSHQHLIVIEEHSKQGGLGTILNRFIQEKGLSHLRVDHFGIPDQFVHHGSHGQILKALKLTSAQIFEQVRKEVLV